MSLCLCEIGVAVIGGDRRQVMVAETLAELAAWVKVSGLTGVKPSARLFITNSVQEAVMNSRVVIFPISGVNNQGKVRTNCPGLDIEITPELLSELEPETLLVTGRLPSRLKVEAERLRLKVLEYAELDEIAVPNGVPTAEGAIQLAMEQTDFTINESHCLVLGYGRVSRALVTRLLSLGANVTVVARNPRQRQEAMEIGCTARPLTDVVEAIKGAEIVFNSIPALVLTAEIIKEVSQFRQELLIIDLASAPGGIDFPAAESVGFKAFLALGLPGKVAPLTAGRILASNLPGLINAELDKINDWH